MDRSKLNIGAYYLAPYASTEQHVKEVAECGIDMIVNMRYDLNTLDLFEKYHVGAIVTGVFPGWFGGDGSNAGMMEQRNPLKVYKAAGNAFKDHPAIWGIDTGDEPSSLDFTHYGHVFSCVKEMFPDKLAYLNIYPSYGVKGTNTVQEIRAQLGTDTHAQYIEEFCKKVDSDYICFDYYLYSADIRGAYESFCVVSDACLRTKRSLWVVLQVNSNEQDKWISENQLRFQANMALAFGAEVITWACYTAGWWYNHVLDKKGKKTEQYDKLKQVNQELHLLDEEYRKYRHVATHFVGSFDADELGAAGTSAVKVLNTETFYNVKACEGQPLLVGQMKKRTADGDEALMICAADDPFDKGTEIYQVQFKVRDKKVRAFSGKGERELKVLEDGSYMFEVRSGEGILLTV